MSNIRKPKFSPTATDLIGMIFTPIALIFFVIKILVNKAAAGGNAHVDGDQLIFSAIFDVIVALFSILGGIFLFLMIRRRSIYNRLFSQGNYVMAQVTSVLPNYSIRVNGRSPYVAECSYTDPNTGVLHLFRSRNIYFDPTAILMDAMVPVYADPDNFRHYYVDIDSVLPEVQRH